MKQTFVINATARSDQGKGASRRLRHANKVPGIVYGASFEPASITIEHNELMHMLEHESFYTSILDLDIDGKKEQVVLRDLQRHHFKPRIMHLDLQRISAKEKISMRIPLHFVGGEISPAVKLSGALISHLEVDVEVRCLPKDLPEFIEVDLSKIEVNQTVNLSDLKLSENVEITALSHDEDKAMATAYVPRVVVEETEAPATAEVPVAGDEAKEGDAAAEGGEANSKDKDKDEKKGK